MPTPLPFFLASLLFIASSSCVADHFGDGENDSFPDGKDDGGVDPGSREARAVLALVNDPQVSFVVLSDDGQLASSAASGIIEHRNGQDGIAQTDDDDLFDDLNELDSVPFVGPLALERLLEIAIQSGLLEGAEITAIFSPQPKLDSHTARIAQMIDDAKSSIDIAIYSFSDADVSDALERAIDRNVEVRFLFETANDDKRLSGGDLLNSKSGRLEEIGVDVRFVNKIMHHKFVIVDGPRDDLGRARTAKIASGSANWSFNAATVYDENTMFVSGSAEVALRLQREFNFMWEHARDLVMDVSRPHILSTLAITDDLLASQDDPSFDLVVTSDNFSVNTGSTTFRTDKSRMTVSDAWVAAIERAESQILIASGHLRLRPVAEALVAKRAANPDIDIRVYLDGQEYISFDGDSGQLEAKHECVANATTDAARFNCENKSFRFSKQVIDGGVSVRFKYYAFRWHNTYAVQMHHKYMLIDGKELFAGSYNLSINAEHSTFENVMAFRGSSYSDLIDAYIDNFETVWRTGEGPAHETLRSAVANDDVFPIVFEPMALSWRQVSDLKSLMIDNCPDILSEEFRRNAPAHKVCARAQMDQF